MDLNLDIEKLVELEIKRQVQVVVESKLKDLTMKKLDRMGYGLENIIKVIVREEAKRQLNVKDFAEKISKDDLVNKIAELFKEELFDAINSKDYRY